MSDGGAGLNGKRIGRYTILGRIGEGGMGEVYLAEDASLKRKVALKLLPLTRSADEETLRRFQREAEAIAALNHPNIVTIYEIDKAGGQAYIAMEYVDGKPLDEFAPASDLAPSDETVVARKLDAPEIIDLALQICRGLSEAHDTGIIHRDIKPQNILLGRGGRIKILDFGLAKLSGGSAITQGLTIMGSVMYMSPEQARGEELDRRTDIWSVGAVLYRVATGAPPFPGDTVQSVLNTLLTASPVPPREIRDDLPADLERIVLKCLSKDRAHRYDSLRELAADLEKAGRRLEGAGAPPAERKAEKLPEERRTERRQATVLAVEVRGFDALQQEAGFEEAATLTKEVAGLMRGTVEKYGGTVAGVVGGDLTALFGVPSAVEAATARAVNSAIEIRQALADISKDRRLSAALEGQAGICTGTVIAETVVSGGKVETSAVGSTVTHAGELRDLAGTGQVLVDPATVRATRTVFEYSPVRVLPLKGGERQAQTLELTTAEVRPLRPEFRQDRQIHSEMVGRERELDALKFHVMKSVHGEGSIVAVVGEAGIGKSRLVRELRAGIDHEKVSLIEGWALSVGENLSYHPIIDALRRWAGINENETEEESLARLRRTIENVHPSGADEILPFIATMMQMKVRGKDAGRLKGIEGEAMEKLIIKSLRELIITAAGKIPLVIMMHDIHWADLSTIELLESLFRLAETHRILFVVVLRPNYEWTGDRILATARERFPALYREIPLRPLDGKDSQRLIANLMKTDSLPAGLAENVVRRAEGNPFFVEEVVRSLVDEGVIEAVDGRFQVSEKAGSFVIPETIQDVLMARIDRLDDESKAVLKRASVIGRFFFLKILSEITRSADDVDNRLEGLKMVQLLRDRTRMGELEYFFKHALAQEVTYSSLLEKKRKEIHLQVARAVESVFSEKLHEFYGMLALHYSLGEDQEKAEEYLVKAGEEALNSAASNEALSYYSQALNLYLSKAKGDVDREKVAMMEKNIALAFHHKGKMREAVEYLDRVFEYWGYRAPRNRLLALLRLVGNLSVIAFNLYTPFGRGNKDPGRRDVELLNLWERRGTALTQVSPTRFFVETVEVIRLCQKFDLRKVENGVAILVVSSSIFLITGISFALSKRILDFSAAYLTEEDVKSSFRHHYITTLYDFLAGAWRESPGYDDEAFRRGNSIGDVFYTCSYVQWIGWQVVRQGRFKEVPPLVAKLDEIEEIFGHELAKGRKHSVLALLHLQRREFAEADGEIDAGISFFDRIDQKQYSLFLLGMKVHLQTLSGDLESAEKSLAEAQERSSREKRIFPFYGCTLAVGELAFTLRMMESASRSGNKEETVRWGREAARAVVAARKNAAKFAGNRAGAARLTGTWHWLRGRRKKALSLWGKSLKEAEKLDARPDLARTCAEVGTRLLEGGKGDGKFQGLSAGEWISRARTLFGELDLRWDLEQLDGREKEREAPR